MDETQNGTCRECGMTIRGTATCPVCGSTDLELATAPNPQPAEGDALRELYLKNLRLRTQDSGW